MEKEIQYCYQGFFIALGSSIVIVPWICVLSTYYLMQQKKIADSISIHIQKSLHDFTTKAPTSIMDKLLGEFINPKPKPIAKVLVPKSKT